MKRSVLTLCGANLLLASAAVGQSTDFGAPISEPLAPEIRLPADSESRDLDSAPTSVTEIDEPTAEMTFSDVEDGDLRNGRRIEVINERFDTGDVRVRREVTLDAQGNYVQHGSWTMYDRKGSVVARGMYEDNEREGSWMRIHDEYPDAPKVISRDSGGDFAAADYESFKLPFTSNAVFRNGMPDGVWIMHDANDDPVFSLTFRDGERDGSATWFHPDGETKAVVEFKNGIVDGIRMEYDSESEVIRQENWEAGRKLAMKSESHQDDQTEKKFEAMYLHSRYVVDIPDDWWSGRVATYHADGPEERHGDWTSWHDNGQKKLEGTFKMDLREGTFTWWFPNGQVRTRGRYESDKPVGRWVWYHENGQKASEGTFRTGQPDGHWSFWESTGKLANRVDYSSLDTVNESVSKPESGIPIDRETPENNESVEEQG